MITLLRQKLKNNNLLYRPLKRTELFFQSCALQVSNISRSIFLCDERKRKEEGIRFLKRAFEKTHGKPLPITNPKTFTEKLCARMIKDCENGNPLFTQLSDKIAVRKIISDKIGTDHIIPIIWDGENPNDIPFNALPHQCIIKTNHGSGGNIVINSNPDKALIIQKLRLWLKQNYYWTKREIQYYGIKPRILIEPMLSDGFQNGPLDYRFFCINGEPRIIQVDNATHTINPFYDTSWEKLDLNYRSSFVDTDIDRPLNFDKMLSIARTLAQGIDFVRVDLFNIHGQIFFTEMTFTPVAGQLILSSAEWDAKLGEEWCYV